MSKIIEYENDARERLLSGVDMVAKAVRVTLGPSGRNVIIKRNKQEAPIITKDGVTVASQVESDDEIEQIAIELVQNVANETDGNAGDGTSTATILAAAILKYATELENHVNYIEAKRGIDQACIDVVRFLKENVVSCDKDYKKLHEVAMISSNGDKMISDIVIEAYKKSGNQGTVNINRSKTIDTYTKTIEGINMHAGYRSVYYQNNEAAESVYFEKALLYITNAKINVISKNFGALLTYCAEMQIPIVIMSQDMAGAVSQSLIENRIQNQMQVCAVNAPAFGNEQVEELKDLGVYLGQRPFIENEFVLEDLEFPQKSNEMEEFLNKHFPIVESILVTEQVTSIKNPVNVSKTRLKEIKAEREERADMLRDKIDKARTQYEKGIIQSRISKLSDGLVHIYLGAGTDVEFTEKQHRLQDALYAVKYAAQEGILPGGGTALYHASKYCMPTQHSGDDFYLGYDLLCKSIVEPYYQILENVGFKREQAKKFITEWNTGMDARNQVPVKNMIKAGIIDPLKVTRTALEKAVSVASALLTTDCAITLKN